MENLPKDPESGNYIEKTASTSVATAPEGTGLGTVLAGARPLSLVFAAVDEMEITANPFNPAKRR